MVKQIKNKLPTLEKKTPKTTKKKKSGFVESGGLRNALRAGALVAEAGSKGSAGNVASKIIESDLSLDLSNFRKRNGIDKNKKDKSQNNGKGPASVNEANVWMPEKKWGDFPGNKQPYA